MKKGFSLLELLLATALITIGLVSLLNAFSIGFSQAGQAQNFLVAKNLAEEKLEEIRNASYVQIIPEAKAAVSDFADYQRQVEIAEIQSGLKQINIQVFWTERGSEISIALDSFVSDI